MRSGVAQGALVIASCGVGVATPTPHVPPELVKVFRGEAVDKTKPAGADAAAEDKIQPVRDVVLQRAVDVLKGIRVLLSWR